MRALYVEPFETGSHQAFGAALERARDCEWIRWSLPGRHWKWRMRGAGLWFAAQARREPPGFLDVVLASSFTPLADLVALVPYLAQVPSVLYFHEDQWSYPERPDPEGAPVERADRDHHFGVTQLVSAAVADRCWFNSAHCRDAFLDGCKRFLARMPDARPEGLVEQIAERAEVVGFPVDLPTVDPATLRDVPAGPGRQRGPLLLWNHRWEHDKDPGRFFGACDQLASRGVPFRLAVCGETFRRVPPVFETARERHRERIEHWGHAPSRADYLALLRCAQVVVSTARHEFFGVSVLEAVHCGACPLLPAALAYPELFGSEFLYRDERELVDRLAAACVEWTCGDLDLRADRRQLTDRHAAEAVVPRLVGGLRGLASVGRRRS